MQGYAHRIPFYHNNHIKVNEIYAKLFISHFKIILRYVKYQADEEIGHFDRSNIRSIHVKCSNLKQQ